MNYGEGALSASDVALLTGNGNNGGFGNNGDGWWIILLFLCFGNANRQKKINYGLRMFIKYYHCLWY